MSLGRSAYLNGMREDFDTIKDELDQIAQNLSSQA
jgi:hypothetical protein